MDHFSRMDRIYHYQRYFYDVTRPLFLFGRNTLLSSMNPQAGDHILEVGCGTARNLAFLAREHPKVNLFGLDASKQMLDTAEKALSRLGDHHIKLSQGLAEELDHKAMFGLDKPFDTVFFSYSLTMIPDCEKAINAALANLRPGGQLHLVDFGDQRSWPAFAQLALKKWLSLFHVYPKPELLAHLSTLEKQKKGTLNVSSILGGYAMLGCFFKT